MAKLVIPVSARDHARGPENASLTLVQYGDFQCPHCAQAYPDLAAMASERSDSLRFVFRHFPLTDAHPQAQHAALSSMGWTGAHPAAWAPCSE